MKHKIIWHLIYFVVAMLFSYFIGYIIIQGTQNVSSFPNFADDLYGLMYLIFYFPIIYLRDNIGISSPMQNHIRAYEGTIISIIPGIFIYIYGSLLIYKKYKDRKIILISFLFFLASFLLILLYLFTINFE